MQQNFAVIVADLSET